MKHPELLERKRAALVVVDMQEAFRPVIVGFAELVERISLMVKGALTLGIPIIVTEQYPKGLGRTVTEIAGLLPEGFEPIEKLSIYTPNSGTPKINSSVSSHNGQILGFEAREGWPGWDRVDVYLPHAERQNFIIELRSLTQGLATFEAQFDHMVEVTGRRADDVAKKAQASAGANGH